MKLAELLTHKKDMEAAFQNLHQRLISGAKKYEGEEELDDTKKTLEDLIACSRDLEQVRLMINGLNFKTSVNNEGSLQHLIFQRDTAKQLFAFLTNFVNNLESRNNGYATVEKKFVRTFDPHEARKLRDNYATEWRRLDLLIQQTNWQVEVPLKKEEPPTAEQPK